MLLSFNSKETPMANRKTAEIKFEDAAASLEAFAAPALGAAQEQVRAAVETGVSQLRDGFAKAQTAFEKNGAVMGSAVELMTAHARSLQEKTLEIAKTNSAAALAFTSELAKAKTLSDVIELQTSHARKAMETFLSQGKEMASLFQKGAADAAATAKDMLPAAA
jgi:hypothetical protein